MERQGIMLEDMDFDEVRQSQLPMVELLVALGYSYLSNDELMRQRGGDYSNYLLKSIATDSLMQINQYESDGQTFRFRREDIVEAIDELENIQFEGLIDTSKNVYNMIMPLAGGKTVRIFNEGKYESKSLRFIDFKNPEKNAFHVAVEVVLSAKDGKCRPDIICYVNGLPFVVVENKKSSVDVRKAIDQMIRNQSPEYSPRFFAYPQSLIGANSQEFKYGTTGAKAEFYVKWKEKEKTLDELNQQASRLIKHKIDETIYSRICEDLSANLGNHKQKLDRQPTEQDRATISLLSKDRLLNIAKNFIIYDGTEKKIMRYQQFFAVNKILQRIHEKEAVEPHGERRRGGIIWHTQGSGKSLTMVMFVRALIEDPAITNPRVLIVTDRRDLDRQITSTFRNVGLKKKVTQATSGRHLLKLIRDKDTSVITTLVQKFESAKNQRAGFVDLDQDIFVLIDEAHRTQYGTANMEMNRIIPNACYIAFTGTPLLKKDKSQRKFDSFIDKYTIDDALADEVILHLIYEGRYVDLVQDKQEIDRQIQRLTEGLSEKQKKLLQKNVKLKIIKDNPQRITEIVCDIQSHYIENFQGTGLKAQIVAPSKYSAVMMQKIFQNAGKIKTALVISGENDIVDKQDEHKEEVLAYLKSIKDNYVDLLSYEKAVIESFKNDDKGVEVLIVVDKLLTGFDAPRNTALYLAKQLRDHNLLQAIARVNRLYNNDQKPKTAGFIIDYSENAKDIKKAMQLFGNYDDEDVKSALIDIKEKIGDLQGSRQALQDIFEGVDDDGEAYLRHLDEGQHRQDFYGALSKHLKNFSECMVLRDFVNNFEDIDLYRRESKKFMELRKSASLLHGEDVDFSRYKGELTKIIDKNIKAKEAELLTQPIDITNSELFNRAIESMGSNHTKAKALAAQTQTIIQSLKSRDPEFYRKFSEKITAIIESMKASKLADLEALHQLQIVSKQVLDKDNADLPPEIAATEGADFLYRNLKGSLRLEEDLYQQVILDICKIIKQNVRVDWWNNNEVKRIIKNKVDDYIYDKLKVGKNIDIPTEQVEKILDDVMQFAENNQEVFK